MTDKSTHEALLADAGADFLEHYGIKGMKWGVVKDDDADGGFSLSVARKPGNVSSKSSAANELAPSDQPPKTEAERKKELAKKAAIGIGVLAVAAGAGYAAYSLNKNGKLPISSLKKPTEAAESATKKILSEPTSVVHASRGHAVGFKFLKSGGLSDAFQEYERAGFTGHESGEVFLRYGVNKEKVAARFLDPQGRKDLAGRTIPHDVFVPAALAKGLNSLADVKDVIWPLLQPDYDEFYNTVPATQMTRSTR